jgi:phosphoglycerate dehydrogenase-like enzyme
MWMADAIAAGGGHVVPLDQAEALVWGAAHEPSMLERVIEAHPNLRWIQLPFAGIENYVHLVDDEREWTCGKGVYAEPVAEMALALALAGMRGLGTYARATSWGTEQGTNLFHANVTILGGGGITQALIGLLAPFDCRITVVRNRVQEMDGVDEVVEADRYIDALVGADLVVVALALTPDTEFMLSRNEFELMEPHAWVVNVARGRHIVTDDLVWALTEGQIGGAALDVTDPEPLPDGHPLWSLPNCIVTPHAGSTWGMSKPLLSERIAANVKRFGQGDELLGSVFPDLQY